MSGIALMTVTALLRLLSASGDSTAAWNGGVGKFSRQMATEFPSIGQGSPAPPYSGDVWPGFLRPRITVHGTLDQGVRRFRRQSPEPKGTGGTGDPVRHARFAICVFRTRIGHNQVSHCERIDGIVSRGITSEKKIYWL